MSILKIYTYGNDVLKKKAEPVQEVTPELQELADDMLETMYDAPGIGLAAPQIGKSIQLIVVDVSAKEEENEPIVLFNPRVEAVDGCDLEIMEEGCLSVPGIWAEVTRPTVINVYGLDRDGNEVVMENVEGMKARCLQHEIDHLNGTLFVEKVSPTDRAMIRGKLKKLARKKD